jgi:ribosome-associated translation inhibitor RaiA
MDRLLIEWGKMDRTEAIETAVFEKAEKILKIYPRATNLVVGFKTTNPTTSKGVTTQKVTMELRLPNNQDLRTSKEGTNLYTLLTESEKALLAQKK